MSASTVVDTLNQNTTESINDTDANAGLVQMGTHKWIHRFIWHSALLGYGMNCLAQCADTVTEWDNRTWCAGHGVDLLLL